jgi:hypothetical protein
MRLFFISLLSIVAAPLAAHEGHGNTVIHALAHFFEGYGPLLWAGVIVGVIGIAQFVHRRSQKK